VKVGETEHESDLTTTVIVHQCSWIWINWTSDTDLMRVGR